MLSQQRANVVDVGPPLIQHEDGIYSSASAAVDSDLSAMTITPGQSVSSNRLNQLDLLSQ